MDTKKRLRAALATFIDARCVIGASCKALEVDQDSDEVVALRVGLRMLADAYDAMDRVLLTMPDSALPLDGPTSPT
jgi:hypothetical protein